MPVIQALRDRSMGELAWSISSPRWGVFIVFWVALQSSSALALDPKLESSLQNYQDKFPLNDSTEKLIDEGGHVPSSVSGVDSAKLAKDLKGTKNFRYVLNGLLYRGGKISPDDKKGDNRHPMSAPGLKNLCEQGFRQAVYLYPNGMKESQRSVECSKTPASKPLIYKRLPPLSHPENVKAILRDIKQALDQGDYRPTYVHCWNGWHASGYISAVALIQFCGFTTDDAVNYWNVNTDHVCKGAGQGKTGGVGYEPVRQQLRAFPAIAQTIPEVAISDELQKKVCPPKPEKVNQEAFCDRY
jgi:hypothetical protein